MALLSVRDLKISFQTEDTRVYAVDGISFDVPEGKILGIVGESGCGKSVTAMSIINLLPQPPGSIDGGQILWHHSDILKMNSAELASIRGKQLSMIFQDPMTSLNPVFSIGRIMGEVATKRLGVSGPELTRVLENALLEVGISDPKTRLLSYPHELSGGLKQRIMIAMALLGGPKLLIADEPTTALDVTIQKQILYLIKKLQQEKGMSVILITHDLGVVAEMCDEVVVMYAGRIVERGTVKEIFDNRQHPYTDGLFSSLPMPGQTKDTPLRTIEGNVPTLTKIPVGCRFAPRCPRKEQRCLDVDPTLQQSGKTHSVACHFPIGQENPS